MTTRDHRHHRSDIYSHVDQATPVVVVCPWCNTWFHTINLQLAETWLAVTHPPNCRKGDTMATAGPAKDMTEAKDQDWIFRCTVCQEILAGGSGPMRPIEDNQVIQEAERNHVCPGKRSGRITED